MKKMFAFMLLLLFISSSFAQNNSDLLAKISSLEHDIEIVKRDQLNYSIEKDLLKESYSNNYQTINIFITIVLGVFSVLGYLGIRSISSINKEYQNELRNLIQVKEKFESQMAT